MESESLLLQEFQGEDLACNETRSRNLVSGFEDFADGNKQSCAVAACEEGQLEL